MRAFSTLCVLTLVGCASAGGTAPAEVDAPQLSNFDYVVLASLADAGSPISLAVYSPIQSHN
ncbi:MAG TPA: hypothetical protein VGI93_07535 [Steroidobacteraceae bacterium]|jgi:hypothetical protein